MKRVRCPKCDNFITFDETKYEAGQSLVFVCPNCNKQFGIRMGVSKLRETRKEETIDENANENGVGSIVVIENVFAYKQVIPLQMGDNVIGRFDDCCGSGIKKLDAHVVATPANHFWQSEQILKLSCNDGFFESKVVFVF